MSAPSRFRLAALVIFAVVSVSLLLFNFVSPFLSQNVASPTTTSSSIRPNVVFILTDDQDVHLDSVSYQPLVKKYLIDEGLTFQHHYCTVAICCPSRVNLWTGLAAHNTNVTDVSPPYGGYPKFVSQGLNEKYLPVWLQNAGINTYYTGKLFNAHSVDNYNVPYPAGFTGSDFLLDPYTYSYLNSTWQRNQEKPVSYEGLYTTDIIAQKANGFLEEAIAAKTPFFLVIAPVAPHFNIDVADGMKVTPPIAADRHKDLFKDVKIPRTDNFNPEQPSGASWIRQLARQNQTHIEYNDEFYRLRLRALQAVDELVEGVVQILDQHDILDNSYLIYSSDNGFHIGQHRLPPGKECGYEEDINIPLVIRGPGIPKGGVTSRVSSHTDLAPTILRIFGLQPRADFDGISIPLDVCEQAREGNSSHEHVNVEFWGSGFAEGKYGFRRESLAQENLPASSIFPIEPPSFIPNPDNMVANNTYKALRLISKYCNLYYSVWCNNEHELYDLNKDPHQLHNLYPSPSLELTSFSPLPAGPTILGLPVPKIISRLDALLLVLKSCKADACVKPWEVLHPSGNVKNLKHALKPGYDAFYEKQQPKIRFERCEPGYILDAEGPRQALTYREGLSWDVWT